VVQARAEAIVDLVERSDALFGSKTAVISELWGLAHSHAGIGWDGGESLPVDRQAIARAAAFIRALPEEFDIPEVGVDPDGSVTLDWIASRHRMLTLGVAGNSDRLAYAWIDGTDRGHAVARFDKNVVPARLMQAILAVTLAPDHAALRAA